MTSLPYSIIEYRIQHCVVRRHQITNITWRMYQSVVEQVRARHSSTGVLNYNFNIDKTTQNYSTCTSLNRKNCNRISNSIPEFQNPIMLHQRLGAVSTHTPSSSGQAMGNKQISFLDQLRSVLQRPILSEKCRDLGKLLTLAIPPQQQDQG